MHHLLAFLWALINLHIFKTNKNISWVTKIVRILPIIKDVDAFKTKEKERRVNDYEIT